jgi:hypothetical protein
MMDSALINNRASLKHYERMTAESTTMQFSKNHANKSPSVIKIRQSILKTTNVN